LWNRTKEKVGGGLEDRGDLVLRGENSGGYGRPRYKNNIETATANLPIPTINLYKIEVLDRMASSNEHQGRKTNRETRKNGVSIILGYKEAIFILDF
jgi:hypothetical protein